MNGWLIALISFLVMEPVTAALHRWLFHGPGWTLHADHHRATGRNAERNDVFPVVIGFSTFLVMLTGTLVESLRPLFWIGVGLTAYGALYALVHDVFIHRRLRLLPKHLPGLQAVREAHRVHHLYGGAPYGMLLPVVPRALAAKARGTTYDPLVRTPGERRGSDTNRETSTV